MEDQIKGLKINSAGYGTVPKLIMQDKSLSVYSKAIYAYFCSFTGGGDSCFPSRDKICSDLNISISSYQKYLKALVERGYITVEQQKNESGTFARNVYTLKDVVPAVECETVHGETVHCETAHGATVHGETDTNNNNINNNNINNNNNNNRGKKSASRFKPPTFEEVRAYCSERKNNIDAQRFIDYYTSNGWRVGKNSMKDWKAAVRTWERSDNSYSVKPQQTASWGNNNPPGYDEMF